jgi:pimeloyl-ACP methyl ester carboxylesterase
MAAPRLHHVSCLRGQALHRMAYWEWGDPANQRVVVCVHGLSRQGRDFDALAQRLAVHYRVVCPDVMGRGQSDWLPDAAGYQVPAYVGDMVTLLARLNVAQVDWVGTSMGGLIGMVLAALPGRAIGRFVLNDVGPVLELAAMQRIGSYVGKPQRWASVQEGADALLAISKGFGQHSRETWTALSEPMLKRDGNTWVLHYDPRIAEPFKAITPEQAQTNQSLLWHFYDAITCPTLLLRGANSDLLSVGTAQAMALRGPQAHCHEFANVGHAPMLNSPEQMDVVAAFLSERLP